MLPHKLDVKVKHVSGSKNIVANCLSRKNCAQQGHHYQQSTYHKWTCSLPYSTVVSNRFKNKPEPPSDVKIELCSKFPTACLCLVLTNSFVSNSTKMYNQKSCSFKFLWSSQREKLTQLDILNCIFMVTKKIAVEQKKNLNIVKPEI